MQITKKGYIWLFVIIIVIALAAIIYYFFTKDKVEDPNKSNTPVPPGSQSNKWIPESFPLNVGMFGEKIREIQKKFNISPDGKFGPITKGAAIAAGYTVPISQEDYDKIVGTPATKIKGVYAKYDNTVIRNKSLAEVRKAKKDEWLGKQTGVDDTNSYYELDGQYYVIKTSSYLVG